MENRATLTFPIPQFDVDNKDHNRLTELSEICHKKIQKEIVQITQKSSARIRGVIRNSINQELSEINEIVKKLLKKQPEMSFSA